MATKNVNTSKNIKENPGKQITQASIDAEIKKAGAELEKAKKVKVKVPAYLKNRLGSVLPVGINGAIIYIPVGEQVEVPEPYKAVLEESLDNLNL